MVVQFYILSLLRCPQVIQFLICRVEACHHSWVRTNDNSFSRRCTVRAWRISAQGQSNRTRWNSWSWRSEQRRVPLRWLKWLIISVKNDYKMERLLTRSAGDRNEESKADVKPEGIINLLNKRTTIMSQQKSYLRLVSPPLSEELETTLEKPWRDSWGLWRAVT